jgi:DnaA family protein
LLAALQLRARWRGLDLSADAAGYLLRRVTREFSALFELLDKADRAALAAQRRLTVPFLKSVLETQQA